MFKKFFGKKAPQQKASTSNTNESESSRGKIYPIFKPGDWIGLKAGAIRKVVLGTQEEPTLVLGFGYDTPENFVFLTHLHLKEMEASKVLAEAFQNIDAYEAHFEYAKSLQNQVLTCSGSDFASEKILSTKHMLKAHDMLKAEELYVSIPRRRCMMVVSKTAPDSILDTFYNLHDQAWNDDSYGNPPITNVLFAVKAGNITGLVSLTEL